MMNFQALKLALTGAVLSVAIASAQSTPASQKALPHTSDGKPDFSGIWQATTSTADADLEDHVAGLNMLAGRSVLADGGTIPYQPWAAKQKAENFQKRQAADPLSKCYIPSVPRVMYMEFPFQIFQTPTAITMAFEWELDYRLVYMDGSKHPDGENFWMGDSRGHWDGDTLVVDVSDYNDKTRHENPVTPQRDALHVVERYRMTDHDTIHYEATMEDSKVFTKPWTIALDLHRRTDRKRLYEYVCEAELEETNGAFTREDRTWYPGNKAAPPVTMAASSYVPPPVAPVANLRRTPDGKPYLQGFLESQTRGANQGLEKRGLIVDPADGKLPMQPWAVEERASRRTDERGYDDPTAHCFPPGAPRAMWVPEGFDIIQTPNYLVLMYERVAWRIVPIVSKDQVQKSHLPDNLRLWEGDSVGYWDGDTFVIDTTNFNGKTWLNEAGEIVSYAEHSVERITPTGPDTFRYDATVTDPIVYTRPWTVSFPMRREKFELREAACHEEDHDLPHLKALKDAAAAKKQPVPSSN